MVAEQAAREHAAALHAIAISPSTGSARLTTATPERLLELLELPSLLMQAVVQLGEKTNDG
jgi:hypothetical protein